jgi:hypothetical protein
VIESLFFIEIVLVSHVSELARFCLKLAHLIGATTVCSLGIEIFMALVCCWRSGVNVV